MNTNDPIWLAPLLAAALALSVSVAASIRDRFRGRDATAAELQMIVPILPTPWLFPPVRVISTSRGEAKVGSGVLGLGRTLLIADHALTDDEVLRAALAHEGGHLRTRVLPPDLGPIYAAIIFSTPDLVWQLAAAALSCAAGLAHWRREEFWADRRSPAGHAVILAYYEALAARTEHDENFPERAEPRIAALLPRMLQYPTVAERIAALRREGRGGN